VSKPFLLDENISPRVRVAIQRHYPHMDVLQVGDGALGLNPQNHSIYSG
jgi:hypothetical protein